jgi:predicted nucleic acid-binding protein
MKKTEYKLLDSSAWLAYFYASSNEVKRIIEAESVLFLSPISIFEVKRKLLKDKKDKEKAEELIGFMKERSIILSLTEKTCESAVAISLENKLPAIDSMIYATARESNSLLVTADNDFRGMEAVQMLE